jgi:quercetin dioxygenase-like cupin family protein
MRHRLAPAVLLSLASALIAACATAQSDEPPATSAVTLLETPTSVDGVPFSYPTGAQAVVTAVEVTWPEGSRTGWHQHDVPLFNYVLEGRLGITYADGTERVLEAGDAVVETVSVAHWGRNDGPGPARLLTVVLGADGVPYTTQRPELEAPAP